ncbi:MAG: hypothetical protein JXQ87_15695 [Bacteroidia bacterium]
MFSRSLPCLLILILNSCASNCYETGEPEVYIRIINSCHVEEIKAFGLREPIGVYNDCDSNFGKATITLPLYSGKKTYYLTDGFNTIDSFTINYVLNERFQEECGYVVILEEYNVDPTASSIMAYHQLSKTPNDTINTYITYSTFADYMDN